MSAVSPSTNGTTLAAAMAYHRAGLSIIPIRPDGSKRPAISKWEPYQQELPTADAIGEWFDKPNPPGIGVIGGAVSAGLECIDFDQEADTIFPAWCELVEAERPGLISRLSIARTPKPGFHVRYRCAEVPIPGNAKLAGSDKETLIETRGEGGYALAPGCPAACHKTGRTYEHHTGPKLSQVSTITQAERETLIRCARSFDRKNAESPNPFKSRAGQNYPVAEDFDRRACWEEILHPHGWEAIRQSGRTVYWRRPGKDEPGWSATTGACTGKDGIDLLAIFSSNAAPFEGPADGRNCTCYGKFRAFAMLNHQGDLKAATRGLASRGYGPPWPAHQSNETPKPEGSTAEARGLVTICLAAVPIEPIHWLIPGLLPLGKNALIAGDGGLGKTSIALDLAACLTTGRQAFGLDYPAMPPSNVLLISCEDDAADTLVPRLRAAGADLNRIRLVKGIKAKDGKVPPFGLDHFQELDDELEQDPQCRLVIIDPAGAYVGRAKVDDHKNSELQSLLQPLAQVAAKRHATNLMLTHVNKGAAAKAIHRVMGSAGYVNAVRAAFIVTEDAEDETRRLLLPIKFNLGPMPSGLAYRVVPLGTDNAAQIVTVCGAHLNVKDRAQLTRQLFRIHWEGPVSTTANQAVADASRKDRGPNKVQQAAEWIEQFLGEFAWPSDELMEAGQKAGHTFGNITRAKANLKDKGLCSSLSGFQGKWWNGFGDPKNWKLRQ